MLQIDCDFDYDERMKKGEKDLIILGGYSLKMTIIYIVLFILNILSWWWIALPFDTVIARILLWLSVIPGFLYYYNKFMEINFGIFNTSMLWRQHKGVILIICILLLSGSLYFGYQADDLIYHIILIILWFFPLKYFAEYHIGVTYWAMEQYYKEKQEVP